MLPHAVLSYITTSRRYTATGEVLKRLVAVVAPYSVLSTQAPAGLFSLLSTSFPLIVVGFTANGNRYYFECSFISERAPFPIDRWMLA